MSIISFCVTTLRGYTSRVSLLVNFRPLWGTIIPLIFKVSRDGQYDTQKVTETLSAADTKVHRFMRATLLLPKTPNYQKTIYPDKRPLWERGHCDAILASETHRLHAKLAEISQLDINISTCFVRHSSSRQKMGYSAMHTKIYPHSLSRFCRETEKSSVIVKWHSVHLRARIVERTTNDLCLTGGYPM